MTKEQIAAIRERVEKASPGPWVWADHDIFPEDRQAQREGRPYWTLVEKGEYTTLCVGPVGRKMMSPESILSPGGYDGDGVFGSKEDQEFIANARQDIPALLAYVEELEKRISEQNRAINGCEHGKNDEQWCNVCDMTDERRDWLRKNGHPNA